LDRAFHVLAGCPSGRCDHAVDLGHGGLLQRDAEGIHHFVEKAHHGNREDDPLRVCLGEVAPQLGASLVVDGGGHDRESARHTHGGPVGLAQ
jgi:hypothetical protein